MKPPSLFSPELQSQWSPENEKPLSAYTRGSNHPGIWICEKGHTWQVPIKIRTLYKTGCPFCSGRRAWPGFNDLRSLRPDLALQWHPTKNGLLKPEDVTLGSNKIVMWRCSEGHEWYAAVYMRVNGTDCPYCKHRALYPYSENDHNSLTYRFPEIAAEWDYQKNALPPEKYYAFSNRRAWWKCKEGHSWFTTIHERTCNPQRKCPYCSNRRVIPGKTDLMTLHPEQMLEWDIERNLTKASEIPPTSNKRAWWICPKGHHFRMKVKDKVNGYSCPVCYPPRKKKAINELNEKNFG